MVTLSPQSSTENSKKSASRNSRYSILFLKGARNTIEEYEERFMSGELPLIYGVRYLFPSPKQHPKVENFWENLKDAWFQVENVDYMNPSAYNMTQFDDAV